ncbi:hypothetical protein QTP88_028629 [Uroleucon formosanum]
MKQIGTFVAGNINMHISLCDCHTDDIKLTDKSDMATYAVPNTGKSEVAQKKVSKKRRYWVHSINVIN